MWRRLYLLLIPVRLYFALQASYIHPDEHFQGPEIIAGEVFGWPAYRSWEFTAAKPVRSVLPLWLIYGVPLTTLKWIWEGLGKGYVPPKAAFYCLRLVMFTLSFVFEDWALHELLPDKRQQHTALFFVSSSYVTWTYQAHTFSNSIETLIVLWCLVLIQRIKDDKEHTQVTACIALAFLSVLGVFNRITFPAFLMIPAIQLVPHLLGKPKRMLALSLSGLLFFLYAVALDTEFYSDDPIQLSQLHKTFLLTPWNNLKYNSDPSNLAQHGLHPFWLHFVANLPQLIGPAAVLCVISTRRGMLFWSGIAGIAVLSLFRHQEARFLLPAVPLLLASIRLPIRARRAWVAAWVTFNLFAGILFGVYHQGGVVAAQDWLSKQEDISLAFWWKTYSPPRWLLNGKNRELQTTDLMGAPPSQLMGSLTNATSCVKSTGRVVLVAPRSARWLQQQLNTVPDSPKTEPTLKQLWQYNTHIGLDDLDFAEDGVWKTLHNVVKWRGLTILEVNQYCP